MIYRFTRTKVLNARLGVILLSLFFLTTLSACNAGFGRSDDADLDSLVISGEALSPSFSSDETEYTLTVGANDTRVSITATTDEDDATLTLNGATIRSGVSTSVDLNIGVNVISIVVTAENEGTKTYEIRITRQSDTDDNVALSALQLEGVSTFDIVTEPLQLVYAASVGFLQASTRLKASPDNSVAALTFDGRELDADDFSSIIPLQSDGDTDVEFTVTATDGTATADYTLTVTRDGLDVFAQQEGLVKPAINDPGDEFASSVLVAGDLLFVGAPKERGNGGIGGDQADNSLEDAGAVYVYEYQNSGNQWELQTYIKPNDASAEAEFGSHLAYRDNTLIVSAPGDSDNAGAVYVFTFSNSQWTQAQKVVPSNPTAGDRFGESLSFALNSSGEDTFLVGSPNEDSASRDADNRNEDASDSGAVFLFRESNNTWSEDAYFKAEDIVAGDNFGASVNSIEDILAIGAPGNNGTAYIYRRNSGNTWALEDTLAAADEGEDDEFGASIALSEQMILVGAPGDESDAVGVSAAQQTDNDLESAGAVYAFVPSATNNADWEISAFIKASRSAGVDFGRSLALSANMLAVGAVSEAGASDGINQDQGALGSDNSGAVYLFELVSDQWVQQAYIKSSGSKAGDRFGAGLSLVDGRLAVGADQESSDGSGDNTDRSDSGAVYIFE